MIPRVMIITPYGLRASYRKQRGFDFRLNEWRIDQLLTRVPGGYPPDNDNA